MLNSGLVKQEPADLTREELLRVRNDLIAEVAEIKVDVSAIKDVNAKPKAKKTDNFQNIPVRLKKEDIEFFRAFCKEHGLVMRRVVLEALQIWIKIFTGQLKIEEITPEPGTEAEDIVEAIEDGELEDDEVDAIFEEPKKVSVWKKLFNRKGN